MAEEPEVKVIRMVNLGDTFTKPTLSDFIKQMVALEGDIVNLYIKKQYRSELVYAYVIFEKGCDASKTVASLNKFTYEKTTFDVALIAPGLPHKKYDIKMMLNNKAPLHKFEVRQHRVMRNDRRTMNNRPDRMNLLERLTMFREGRSTKHDLQRKSENKRERSLEDLLVMPKKQLSNL